MQSVMLREDAYNLVWNRRHPTKHYNSLTVIERVLNTTEKKKRWKYIQLIWSTSWMHTSFPKVCMLSVSAPIQWLRESNGKIAMSWPLLFETSPICYLARILWKMLICRRKIFVFSSHFYYGSFADEIISVGKRSIKTFNFYRFIF